MSENARYEAWLRTAFYTSAPALVLWESDPVRVPIASDSIRARYGVDAYVATSPAHARDIIATVNGYRCDESIGEDRLRPAPSDGCYVRESGVTPAVCDGSCRRGVGAAS